MRAAALILSTLLLAGAGPSAPTHLAIDARECLPPRPVTVRLVVTPMACDTDAPDPAPTDERAWMLEGAAPFGESAADPATGRPAVLRHPFGREVTVTIEAASRGRLRTRVRDGRRDISFTYAEDEFLVLLPDLGFGSLLVHLETTPSEQDPA